MPVTTLRWPDGRGGGFTDSNLNRAPVAAAVDDNDTDRNPWRGQEPVETPGLDSVGRFVAAAGDTVNVNDPDVVDHYLDRGWECVDGDGGEADPRTATSMPRSYA